MAEGFTRRGVLQLLAAMTAAVPTMVQQWPHTAPALPAGPEQEQSASVATSTDAVRLLSPGSTRLESYLRARGVRPATLARECGYSRVHLLRIRMGRVDATPPCAVAITYALRRIVREDVVLQSLFDASIARAAWRERRAIVADFHPFLHRSVRAVFGRRS